MSRESRLKMKIGFPNNPSKNILKQIEWIGQNHFDFVDLFLEEDAASPEKIDIKKVKDMLKKYCLCVVGHTAWYLPIGSPVKLLREAAISEATRYFKIFSQLNVEYMTIHANWPPSLFSEEQGIKFQVDSLKKLVKIAKKYNLKVMFEPIDTGKDTLKNVVKILSRVPGLCFHLDIGHANLYKKSIISFIKKFHKKLRHVHLHDNSGEKDEHLPIGKGSINFKKVIKELKKYQYDGTITLEIFSKNKNSVLQSKEKLRKFWSSN